MSIGRLVLYTSIVRTASNRDVFRLHAYAKGQVFRIFHTTYITTDTFCGDSMVHDAEVLFFAGRAVWATPICAVFLFVLFYDSALGTVDTYSTFLKTSNKRCCCLFVPGRFVWQARFSPAPTIKLYAAACSFACLIFFIVKDYGCFHVDVLRTK